MQLEQAMRILEIVRCDTMGYARDLSYTPTRQEVAKAIETIQEYVERNAG